MKASLTMMAAKAFWAFLLGAALLGCAGETGGTVSPSDRTQSAGLDPEVVRHFAKQLQQYIDALLLCGSAGPGDREEAKRRLAVLQPFHIFAEDPQLVARFSQGDDAARRELARRGMILHAVTVFSKPYDKAKWDDARRTLVNEGEVGQHLLVKTLLDLLLNGQFRGVWVQIRYNLVEVGAMGLETTAELSRALAGNTPADSPVFRLDDLVSITQTLIDFGDKGRPHVEALARHEKSNVRRAAARAMGEAVDHAGTPSLVRLVSEDPQWTVRTAAAQALGRMAPSRPVAGKALVDRLKAEPDRTVRLAVLEALGELHYEEAVPVLVSVLEVPSLDTATAAMGALYHITGEKFTRKELWQKWYVEKYPAWKARRRPR